MRNELDEYLRERAFDDPLLGRVLEQVPLIEKFSRGEAATNFFVSEFVANGEKSFGSLWVLTESWHIEVKNFHRPEKGLQIDAAYGAKGVEWVQLTQGETADGQRTASVHYHVSGQHAEMAGVDASADELVGLLEDFLLPAQYRHVTAASSD